MPAKRPEDSYLLPNRDFNQMLEHAINTAREHINTKHLTGYIPIAYLMLLQPEKGRGKTTICLMPDFDTEHRYDFMEAFGEQMARDELLVMALIFVSEAWRSVYPDGKVPKKTPMPREDPKRIECITAIGQTVEGRYAMSYLDIRRDRNDIMVPVETVHVPYDPNDPNEAQSDLCNAFWLGYRRVLRENIMSNPEGRAMVERLSNEASGSDPEAHNFKFN